MSVSGRVLRVISRTYGRGVACIGSRSLSLVSSSSSSSLGSSLLLRSARPSAAASAAAPRFGGWARSQRRALFIQTGDTPNPNGMKFFPDRTVLEEEHGSSADYRTRGDAAASPLAKALFRVPNVDGVFLGPDFVTITKPDAVDWDELKLDVFAAITEFFSLDLPVVDADFEATNDTAIHEDDSDVVQMVKELLEQRVRPAVQEDGGDIFFHGFDEATGTVQLRLAGSCAGCPSSSETLKHGVENMLMHYIPEVTSVEQIDAPESATPEEEADYSRKLKFAPTDN